MKKMITILALAGFAVGASAQDWQAAIAALPTYKFGETRTALNPLSDAIHTAGGDAAKLKPIADALVGVIQGDATVEAKRIALRALGPIASAEAVPAIVALLNDADVGPTAQWALERNTDPAASKALSDALAAAPADKKLVFVSALGWRKDPATASVLVPLLSGKDAILAAAAADALARIDANAASEGLEKIRKGAKGALRIALDNLALRAAENLLASGKSDAAVKAYGVLGADGESANLRGAALAGLVKAQPDKALERVMAVLTGKDPQLVRVAGVFVRQIPGEAATKAFGGLLAEAPESSQVVLLDALGDRGDPAALEFIMNLPGETSDAVAVAALRALGKIGKEELAPALVMLATNKEGEVKRTAATALATLPGSGTNAAIANMVNGSDAKQAATALTALADRQARDVREQVFKLLDVQGSPVRGEAYAALESLAEVSDLPALVQRLGSGSETENLAALKKTLAAVSNRVTAEDKRADAVLAGLSAATTPEAKAAFLEVLGQIPASAALEALRKEAKGEAGAVRLAAVKALSASTDVAVEEDLLAAAKNAASDDERSVALAGYTRLVRDSAQAIGGAEALKRYEAALALAKNGGERKPIISALAQIPSKRTIEVLEGLKADAEMAFYANSGIVFVSRLISGAYPAYAKEKLAPFDADGVQEQVRKPAKVALALLGGFADYITAWEVRGPYSEPGKDARELYSIPFAPEKEPASALWNIAPLVGNMENPDLKPFCVDLGAIFDGQERVAYLRTNLTADAAKEGILEVGSNDGCKIWLNGKEIYGFKEGRPLVPATDKVPVALNAGKNTLLIAVYQQGGPWGACARLADKDGKVLVGVSAGIE